MGKFLVLVFCVAACLTVSFPTLAPAQQEPLNSVSLLPQWIPQAQFAGYMAALEKGYYRDVGIDLTLLQGGPGMPPFELLESGKATFVTSWLSNAIQERALGKRIVCLAQIIQRSSLMLVARPEIKKPDDLNGRKVGLWAGHFYLQPMMFFQKHGISVEVIPNYSSVALFLRGAVDAMAAMWYNEYHLILNSGINPDELTVFFMNQSARNFPEDGLYTLEETYNAEPQMCENFVEASLRGWQWAFDHEEEALDIVMKHAEAAHTGTNRSHQRWMLARMKDLILYPGSNPRMGVLRPRDYEYVCKILKKDRFVENAPPYATFFRGKP